MTFYLVDSRRYRVKTMIHFSKNKLQIYDFLTLNNAEKENQLALTCSKPTMETPEEYLMKSAQS